MFHYTVGTSKTIEEAISAVTEALKEEKFGVQWRFDIKDKLHEKGVELEKDFVVLEVCNPHEAKKVLTANSLVGYFLPCKIVVYEDDNQTKIGMPKPTELIGMVADEVLMGVAKDIEQRLIASIEKAK